MVTGRRTKTFANGTVICHFLQMFTNGSAFIHTRTRPAARERLSGGAAPLNVYTKPTRHA